MIKDVNFTSLIIFLSDVTLSIFYIVKNRKRDIGSLYFKC